MHRSNWIIAETYEIAFDYFDSFSEDEVRLSAFSYLKGFADLGTDALYGRMLEVFELLQTESIWEQTFKPGASRLVANRQTLAERPKWKDKYAEKKLDAFPVRIRGC